MTDEIKLLTAIIGDDLGVKKGDFVYLGIAMDKIPLPTVAAPLTRKGIRGRELDWSRFLLDVLLDVLGPEGTLLVPTFSYDYARNGTPYHHETSPSELGPFTEYFRTTEGVFRCLHPLNSVAGIGPKAAEILNDVGLAGFGPRSVFGKLCQAGCKFLNLGVSLGRSLTFAHHLEQMYGVNHMYNKLFNTPVFKDGAIQPGPWLCSVRFLGVGIVAKIDNLEMGLRQEGLLKETSRWKHPMQLVRADDAEKFGYRMLDKDPCAWIEDPIEVHIETPGASRQDSLRRAANFKIDLVPR